MPSQTKQQHRFMAAVAHSPAFAKKVGVPQSVGRDFVQADKGRKFAKGGDTMATKNPAKRAMEMRHAAAMKKAGLPGKMVREEREEAMEYRRGGGVRKYASGGLAAGHKTADGIAQRGKTKARQVMMRKGGKC